MEASTRQYAHRIFDSVDVVFSSSSATATSVVGFENECGRARAVSGELDRLLQFCDCFRILVLCQVRLGELIIRGRKSRVHIRWSSGSARSIRRENAQ